MEQVDMPLVETLPSEGTPKQIDLNNDILAGYVVGLTKEGQFLFQVIGTNPGLAELIGMHKHAQEKIQQIYASKQNTSEAILVKMLSELGQMVSALDGKVSRLSQRISALEPKADNKIP